MSHLRMRRLLLIAGSLLVGVLLGELGLRLWLRQSAQPYDVAHWITELRTHADSVDAYTPESVERATPKTDGPRKRTERVLHPFFGGESGVDPGGVLGYYRGRPSVEAFEVLVLGGSVATFFGRSMGSMLERELKSDPRLKGREVHVLNGAHAAYKQPQQLNKLAYLMAQGCRPDVVLNLDGFNEVANGLKNATRGTHPLYPSAPNWAGLLYGRDPSDLVLSGARVDLDRLNESIANLVERFERSPVKRSALAGVYLRHRIRGQLARRDRLQSQVMDLLSAGKRGKWRQGRETLGSSFDPDPAAVIELCVQAWYECSLSIKGICDARGIGYVHALQPTLWSEGAKPMTAKERNLGDAPEWRRGVELGYPRLKQKAAALEQAGVSFLDLSEAFADVTAELYRDPCHFSESGHRLLVPAIAQAILGQLP